jgi:hypothetical protein
MRLADVRLAVRAVLQRAYPDWYQELFFSPRDDLDHAGVALWL